MWEAALYFIFFIGLTGMAIRIWFRDKPGRSLLQGFVVKEEELSDVKQYNRLNGVLWFFYGIPFGVSGIFSLLGDEMSATITVLLVGSVGSIFAILGQFLIYKHCRRK